MNYVVRKFKKDEKGSITVFVLASLLFVLVIITISYFSLMNKSNSQKRDISKIKNEYFNDEDLEQIYREQLASELKVGDYVNYTYDNASNYLLTKKVSGSTNNDQSIAQTKNLNWRILNIDNDEGKVDLICENSTSATVRIEGATGYNNGVLLLNDICEKQYSNSSLGIKARSINMYDIESHLTKEGKRKRNEWQGKLDGQQLPQYGTTKTYEGQYAWYPDIYSKENGSGINTKTTKTNGIASSDAGYTSFTNAVASKATTLTAMETYYTLDIDSTNVDDNAVEVLKKSNWSWVATRMLICNNPHIEFGLCALSTMIGGQRLYQSNNVNRTNTFNLRPVVSLPSNIKIEKHSGTVTDPHRIVM